jgi:PKD repeat protein
MQIEFPSQAVSKEDSILSNNNAGGSGSSLGVVIAVLFAVSALVSCGGSSNSETHPNGIVLSLVPARTSGVAPLSVFFDASATTDAGVTAKPFHDLEYSWSFGDATAGTWVNGAHSGTSKNSATGPVAAHIFETPGTYTVSVTAFDGTSSATTNTTITVQNPDTVFPGSNTVCVSTSGDFVGCPAGAVHAANTSILATAVGNISSTSKRLLFRSGEQWTAGDNATVSQTGPGYIGSYGSGATPKIQATGNNSAMLVINAADWRVVDLEFDGQNHIVDAVMNGGKEQVTLLRLNTRNVNSAFATSDFTLSDQFSIQDSSLTTVDSGVPTGGGIGVWIFSHHFSFQGNSMDCGGGGEHVLRFPKLVKAVVSNNTLSGPAPTKQYIKLHQANPYATAAVWDGTYTEQVVIADNLFSAAAVPTAWALTIGPQNSAYDEHLRNIIVERNWFKPNLGLTVAIIVSATDVSVRNNVADMTTGAVPSDYSSHALALVGARGIEPPPTGVWIYNNSVYNADAAEFSMIMINNGVGADIKVRNNLAYAPNSTQNGAAYGVPTVLTDLQGAPNVSASNNSSDFQVINTSPLFTATPPAIATDWKPTAGSYAINSGTAVPVWSDFYRTSRPQNGVIDMGAAEGN